ncbi:MAG: hypothetical protein IPI06_04140 [Gammaproteobacteria bacterium]|nr:hypothetical protein [Gammaproteobacteria bacterium]
MHRTQLLLDDWQYQALKARAQREGRSMSEVLRGMLNTLLDGPGTRHDELDRIRGVAEDRQARGRSHDEWLYPHGRERR